mmetsp:Transcript_123855/g.246440  ORF Transcript_123855/g.246440 Transcript_123855/m.246440 type:complete len:235 (+) Transcript_123855:452-1156(+)
MWSLKNCCDGRNACRDLSKDANEYWSKRGLSGSAPPLRLKQPMPAVRDSSASGKWQTTAELLRLSSGGVSSKKCSENSSVSRSVRAKPITCRTRRRASASLDQTACSQIWRGLEVHPVSQALAPAESPRMTSMTQYCSRISPTMEYWRKPKSSLLRMSGGHRHRGEKCWQAATAGEALTMTTVTDSGREGMPRKQKPHLQRPVRVARKCRWGPIYHWGGLLSQDLYLECQQAGA